MLTLAAMATRDASSGSVGDPRASADRVADTIRAQVTEGVLDPGVPLREDALATAFDVSRNTIREALRLLAADGLITHQRYKSAVVRALGPDDVRDIYVVRRTLELRAVAESGIAAEHRFATLDAAIAEAETAVRVGAWREVGTASLHFHQAVVGLLGSPRLDGFFRTVIAQLRLTFANARDQQRFQEPWIRRDREIRDLLRGGRREAAADRMRLYLADSERLVLDVVRAANSGHQHHRHDESE
jgi:DNA-binding GntR family transcriptional regulator